VITGAYASRAVSFSAVQTQPQCYCESAVGESVAKRARQQLEMVQDKAVVGYVNDLGQKLAHATGRNDFEYEFYVVLDDDLNAFTAGRKVFVNGAITHTKSEAELAGLLAHELSHAVLSTVSISRGKFSRQRDAICSFRRHDRDLFTLDYSRDMERQADALGTRLIASKGYAAAYTQLDGYA